MPDISLTCPAGDACDYATPELPATTAMELLTMHARIAHAVVAPVVATGKPEKFPRPTIGIDEPIERWQDFTSSWKQYKEEQDWVALMSQPY